MGIFLEILLDIYESTFRPTITIQAPPWSTQYGITKALGRRKRTRATASSWATLKEFEEPTDGIPCPELYISGKAEIGCAVMGYHPAVMEDRWFAYSEDVYSSPASISVGNLASVKTSLTGRTMARIKRTSTQDPLIPQSLEKEERVLTGLRIHFHRSWSGNQILELELEVELEPRTTPGRSNGTSPQTILRLRGKTIRVESSDTSISPESAKRSAISMCHSLLQCRLKDESSSSEADKR